MFGLNNISSDRRLSWLLGILTPISAIISTELVLTFALIVAWKDGKSNYLGPFLPLLALASVSAAISMYFNIDLAELRLVMASYGTDPDFSEFIVGYLTKSLAGLDTIFRFLIFIGTFAFFEEKHERLEAFVRGCFWGLPVVAIVALLQIYGFEIGNTNDYWKSLNRISATFTDPNAFGVFVAVMLPLIYGMNINSEPARFYKKVLILAVVAVGFYSGSRSFVLGLIVFALYLLTERIGVLRMLVLVLLSIFALIGINYLGGSALTESIIHVPYLPSSLRRIAETFSFQHFFASIESRLIFFEAAWRMFLDHKLTGIGLNNFQAMLPAYLQIFTENRTLYIDNANSFYLEFLAEFGLTGLIVALISFSKIKIDREALVYIRYLKISLIVLLLLLVIGPHFDFDELMILGGVVLGSSFKIAMSKKANFLALMFVVIYTPLIFNVIRAEDYGRYLLEKNPDGKEYFWIRRRTSFDFDCNSHSAIGLLNLNQKTQREKLGVWINGELIELDFGQFTKYRISECSGQMRLVNLKIELDNIFVPSLKDGGDQRVLGVQLSFEN